MAKIVNPVSFWTYAYKKRPMWMVGFLIIICVMLVVAVVGMVNGDPTAAMGVGGLLLVITSVFVIKWHRYRTGKSAE
jgi:hypothetical protein